LFLDALYDRAFLPARLAFSVLATWVFTGLPRVALFFFSSVALRSSFDIAAQADLGRYLSVRPFSRALSATGV